ncbi:Hypothetical predicted protein [Xyrichtys novacula]|uniref:Uncharacterized protein n=1 Tax=Xyrichtys novacula TaxID=13765 RepID=A0AAV1G0E0_XYRNO|nr:Hypothetical predicted protein [Xyrichtys novacula]
MSDDSECSTRERENARDFFDGRGANIQSMGSKRERDSREPRRKARGKRNEEKRDPVQFFQEGQTTK